METDPSESASVDRTLMISYGAMARSAMTAYGDRSSARARSSINIAIDFAKSAVSREVGTMTSSDDPSSPLTRRKMEP